MTDRIASLPGYEVLHRLAESDMATVWLARQLSLDRLVAIKVLHPTLVQDPEARARFQAEARAAARINHPGLVQVYDASEHGGLVYFIMEYVPGCTVSDLLTRGAPLSERNALLIAQGVALALGYAWEQERLIHCDIKPDNILIADDGSVKVGDLGLARLMGAATSLDSIEGTPHYCSPEQARGDSDLDCRTDIYALGATMYHMATGRVPFGDGPALDVLRRQIEDFLPDPIDVNTALSPAFGWLVERMMMKDRSIRYADWVAALGDIERVLNGEFPKEPPPPGHSTILRSERRIHMSQTGSPSYKLGTSPGDEAPPKPAQPAKGEKKLQLRKIVVPNDLRSALHGEHKPVGGPDVAREWVYMFTAAAVAAVVYGAVAVYYYLLSERDSEPAPVTAAPTNALRIRPVSAREKSALLQSTVPAPSRPPSRPMELSTLAAQETRSSPSNEKWTNADYARAARLYNTALEQYKEYQRTRSNPSMLAMVEKRCREAIAGFEAVQNIAPPEVDINHLIQQCYQLIADVRQSTLLAPASEADKELSAIVQEAATPPPAESSETDNLILSFSWNHPQPDASERVLKDLARLLQPVAQPSVDLTPDTSLVIFGQVFYLMPMREVARIMKKPQGIRRRVTTAGFPKDSFYYYAHSGEFGNGFDTMLFVTDSADRVVAVQLGNERSSGQLWLDPSSFKTDWSVYDFVEGKTKGSAKWKIAHRVEKKNRVVEIDTELVSHDPNGYFELGDSKSRKALFLPEPIANLILYRIDTLKKAAAPFPK